MRDLATKNIEDVQYQGPDDPIPDAAALETIPCSVCHIIAAQYDNHVLYCDGKPCFRAYHQQCLDPPISSKVVAEWGQDVPW